MVGSNLGANLCDYALVCLCAVTFELLLHKVFVVHVPVKVVVPNTCIFLPVKNNIHLSSGRPLHIFLRLVFKREVKFIHYVGIHVWFLPIGRSYRTGNLFLLFLSTFELGVILRRIL